MSNDNRTGLNAEEILDLLANPNLVEFRNYGGRWAIVHRTGHGGDCGEIASSDLDNLLTVWAKLCEQMANKGEDEGVYEQTAGIAPNVGGDAYEPLQPHLHQ